MSKLLRRILYWIEHRRHEKALAEELEFHRSMRQDELERQGMAPLDAALHSRRALGNTLAARESARNVWIWPWLDQFVRDTRIGARSLLKSPGFTIFATLILSIGIGAAVTVFTYFNAVFFKRLAIPNPAAVVVMYESEGARAMGNLPYSSYLEYQERNRSLAQIGMSVMSLATLPAPTPLRLDGPRGLPIDIIEPTAVNSGFFRVLAVDMLLGRGVEPEDEKTGSPDVVVLNEEAWKRYFSRDASALGKTIYLNNTPHRIVGVAPNSVQNIRAIFPAPPSPQLFTPVREDAPPKLSVQVVGRLRPGVSRKEAQADFSRIAAQLSVEKDTTVSVNVERADLPPSWLLGVVAAYAGIFFVVVFAVLLIACDDIAIMLFARITARRREMGIRVALGGSRLQLVRQLVSENILISILGGAGALIFMLLASRVIERLTIPLPDSSRAVFDWRVLAFTMLTALATTLFFGLRPALECVNRDVVASLTPGADVASRRPGRVRSNLVVGQIAFCTALLIVAATVTRGVNSRTFVNPGYPTDHLLLTDINFVGTTYDRDSQLALFRHLASRLAAAPGILSISVLDDSAQPNGASFLTRKGYVSLPLPMIAIDDTYFRTLQVPLLAGRGFVEQDDSNSAPVGIINQRMASMFAPGENPLGHTVKINDGTSIEIVGVVKDLIHRRGANTAVPVLYRPSKQMQRGPSNAAVTVMTKFSGTAGAASRTIHDTIAELDPSLLVHNDVTLDEQDERRALQSRTIIYGIGVPGAFTLLLGIVGTYGTMATLATQRRREVGIRIALGAHPSDAVRLILREGIQSVLIGVGFGIAAVVIILLWLSRNIGQVNFYDPIAFAAMTLLVIATAGIACYIPAKRASRVDPMLVLRED